MSDCAIYIVYDSFRRLALMENRPGLGPDGRDYWVYPGGKVEPGEEPRFGMERELEEETGLIAVEYYELLNANKKMTGTVPFVSAKGWTTIPFIVTRWRGVCPIITSDGAALSWRDPSEHAGPDDGHTCVRQISNSLVRVLKGPDASLGDSVCVGCQIRQTDPNSSAVCTCCDLFSSLLSVKYRGSRAAVGLLSGQEIKKMVADRDALSSVLCYSCTDKVIQGARYAQNTCLHCLGENMEARFEVVRVALDALFQKALRARGINMKDFEAMDLSYQQKYEVIDSIIRADHDLVQARDALALTSNQSLFTTGSS